MPALRTPRWLRAAAGLPLAAVVLAGQPPDAAAATATRTALDVTAVAFAANQVDVRSAAGTVDLTWTVTDRDAAATAVHGIVSLRQVSRSGPVGAVRLVHYALTPDGVADAVAVSGTARRSAYSYAFAVPRYGPTVLTSWRVVQITAADDRGHSRTLSDGELDRFRARVVATGLVDSTPPTVAFLFRDGRQDEFLFDAGRGATARYFVEVRDSEAGVWKGRLTLTGPGGARITAPFEPVDTGETFPHCGEDPVFGANDLACDVTLTLPAGSPAGSWSISAVEITDNAANTAVVTDVTAEPVRLTRNGVLSATGFSVRPAVVDNWRQTKQVAVTLRPVGARGGVQSFSVRTDRCFDLTTDLTANPDGTVTVQWPISTIFSACRITGIVLVDGAGDVALYGSAFGAPAIDLAVARLPDTDPPVALAARLDTTTVTTTQLRQTVGIGVTVTVDNTSPAPVDEYSVTFYDTTGVPVGGGDGGIREQPDDTVQFGGFTSDLAPGTYTVGFTLFDAAHLHSSYGYPNGGSPPVPGDPLAFTVVEG
ncbi:MAG TPA: hypothetical protein VMU51_26395 [Mycobacteriales bacterium]|nr:hypothetical protein [Mycobacteriales bacterium]